MIPARVIYLVPIADHLLPTDDTVAGRVRRPGDLTSGRWAR